MIIAIDGPAASGKSTTAKLIAEKLSLLYIDSGAMYRAATYSLLENNISLNDADEMAKHVEQISIDQKDDHGKTHTFLNKKDISHKIRTRDIALHISKVASNPKIREILVKQQQEFGKKGKIIMDGRDIGTVVFPNADYKFFMIASVEERAKRRYIEFKTIDEQITMNELIDEIKARDKKDEERDNGPLIAADNAIEIDTSSMTISEQVNFILNYIQKNPK